jgi:methylmalonyl-CoA mutase cobalamin-binding domain/chain
MVSEERADDLIKGIYNGVLTFDEERVVELSKKVVAEGVNAYDAVMKGMSAAMEEVGKLYSKQEYFVPELLLCADALYAGLEILKPHIKPDQSVQAKRQIILGVVEGDIHDIGKNLVKIMFDAAGWTVHDLGIDVKLGRFVEEQQRTNADVVGISALMTTSMLAMPRVIKMIRDKSPNTVIMVGGAPLSLETAKQYGADGYTESAVTAVQEAVRLVEKRVAGK